MSNPPSARLVHWLRAARRRETARRRLHQQANRLRRQARHDLRGVRREGRTVLAVAQARLAEIATRTLGRF